MIFGECPYEGCNFGHMVEKQPGEGFSRHVCDGCGRVYWLRHSAFEPIAYTDEEFKDKFTIDEKAHKITQK